MNANLNEEQAIAVLNNEFKLAILSFNYIFQAQVDFTADKHYGEGYILFSEHNTPIYVYVNDDVNYLSLLYHCYMIEGSSNEITSWLEPVEHNRMGELTATAFAMLDSNIMSYKKESALKAYSFFENIPYYSSEQAKAMLLAVINHKGPHLAANIANNDPEVYINGEDIVLQKSALIYLTYLIFNKVKELKGLSNLLQITKSGWIFNHHDFSISEQSINTEIFSYLDIQMINKLEQYLLQKAPN